MRIGILTAELGVEEVHENERLVEEIVQSGHEPVVINYHDTAVAVTEAGRFLYSFDEHGTPVPVEVEAVIPRINEANPQAVNLGMMALDMLISKGVYSSASPAAIELAKNKMRSQIVLDAAGIPTPYAVAATGIKHRSTDEKRRSEIFRQLLHIVDEDPENPVIIKTMSGTQGLGVMMGVGRKSARSIMEGSDTNGIPVIAQEFVDTPERLDTHEDLRLIVVGGMIVASMKRSASRDVDFRANLSLGATGESYEPTPREAELAIKATEIIGLDVAGVDLLKSHRGPLVTEVNASPGFGIEEIPRLGDPDTQTNIARPLVQLAIQKALGQTVLPPYPDDAITTPVTRWTE